MLTLILVFIGGLIIGALVNLLLFKDIKHGPNSRDIINKEIIIDNKIVKPIIKKVECGLMDKHI